MNHFPLFIRFVSGPPSRSYHQPSRTASPGHTSTTFSSDFPIVFPTVFSTMFPTGFPTRFLTDSRLCIQSISRPVPDPFHDLVQSRKRQLPSRTVNQMASRLSVPFLSRRKRTKTFSQTAAREGLNFFRPAAG